jgi:hypothetical protein
MRQDELLDEGIDYERATGLTGMDARSDQVKITVFDHLSRRPSIFSDGD